MSLGDEIRKALADARADAAVSQVKKEMDKLTRDSRDERLFRPVALVLKELEKCFQKGKNIKFDDILLGKGVYIIRFLNSNQFSYFYWNVNISILDLNADEYVYSVMISTDNSAPHQSDNVYGRFSPGHEDDMVRALAAIIAHYELHGDLYMVETVLKRFTEAFS